MLPLCWAPRPGARNGVAAKMLKMNADSAALIVQFLQAGQENLEKLADAAAGLGQNLDISV